MDPAGVDCLKTFTNECTKVQNPCSNTAYQITTITIIIRLHLHVVGIINSHFVHFFFGPGFNSTFTLTINNNAIIKTVTSRINITFKSLHVHYSQFTLSLCISYKFSSFTHLRPTIHGQKQPMISSARLRSW